MKETRKNKASLYINEKMEYQVVNLEKEYGEGLDGCRYAVASYHDKKTLEEMYSEELKGFSPYIYLTVSEYQAIYEYQKNEKKYANRYLRKHDAFEYSEELTACFHDLEPSNDEMKLNPLAILIDYEEQVAEKEKIDALKVAMSEVSETQRRRLIMRICKGMTFEEIAEKEGVALWAVQKSCRDGEKKIKKLLKNGW